MSIPRYILVLFCSLAGMSCSDSRPTEPTPEKVMFPIGGFSPVPNRDVQAGFTIAGPVYSKEKEKLAECEAAGMPFIYSVGVKLEFTAKQGGTEPTSLDIESIKQEIRAQVEEVMGSSSIYAWYLKPEELRYWKPLELEYLRIASQTIQETDPQKRPVWMYEPNHRTKGALEKTVPFQQISGKGLYTNYAGRKSERAWISWSLSQQREALAAANPGAALVAVLEMFQEPEATEKDLIRSWVRHDSYSSLLAGARAILIYSFASRKGFDSKNSYYSAYAEVAKELNGDQQLGGVFLRGVEATPPDVKLVEGSPTTLLSARKSAPTEDLQVPAFQVKAITYLGNQYLFLINSTPGNLRLKFPDLDSWKPLFAGQASGKSGETLDLQPWEVSAFRRPL